LELNVEQPKFLREVERQLTEVPLADWKTYLKWHLLNGSASSLSEAFVQEDFQFNDAYLGGTKEIKPRWKRCVETTDECLGVVVDAVARKGGVSLITADHGNAEEMLEEDGKSPHTAHTTNPVPLIVTDREVTLRDTGELSDLVPSVLGFLGFKQPSQMTGKPITTSAS